METTGPRTLTSSALSFIGYVTRSSSARASLPPIAAQRVADHRNDSGSSPVCSL